MYLSVKQSSAQAEELILLTAALRTNLTLVSLCSPAWGAEAQRSVAVILNACLLWHIQVSTAVLSITAKAKKKEKEKEKEKKEEEKMEVVGVNIET